LDSIKATVTGLLMNVQIQAQEVEEAEQNILDQEEAKRSHLNFQHDDMSAEAVNAREDQAFEQQVLANAFGEESSTPRVGRNDPCPCGSGKKYKQCHGKLV
ncbi:MAG: SEC-C metal-binding domain-containing protein, partial [Formosimonas sp.]